MIKLYFTRIVEKKERKTDRDRDRQRDRDEKENSVMGCGGPIDLPSL